MTTRYKADPNLLTSVLSGEGVHLEPGAILDGLTPDQAHEVGFTGIPEHAVDGWPAIPPDGWDPLRTRYLDSVEKAKRIAAESDSLGNPILPPGLDVPILANESRGAGLLHAAVHSSHHLGQIITIRQLLGLWPPPAGSITW